MSLPFTGFDQKVLYFLGCARAPTLRSAALKLGITQAALGAAIKKLEKELGTNLFERSSVGVRLTPKGQALLSFLESSRTTLNQGIKKALEQNEATTLRVGCVTHVGIHELMPMLRSLPQGTQAVQLLFGYSLASFEAVKRGQLDFAFVTWTDQPKGLKAIVIREDPKAIVGLKTAFPQLTKLRTQHELKRLPWVLQPKPQYDREAMLPSEGSCYLVNDMFAQRELILSGAGIGEVQLSVFTAAERKRLAICAMPPNHKNVRLYAIYRTDIGSHAYRQMRAWVDQLSKPSKA